MFAIRFVSLPQSSFFYFLFVSNHPFSFLPFQLFNSSTRSELRQLTVADLRVAFLVRSFRLGTYDGIPTDIFEGYPRIMGVYNKVFSHPVVQAHMLKEKASW